MIRHASLFNQLVALFNRNQFHGLVFRYKAEQYSKGFSSWDHFVAMLFCQIAQAKSLREICGGLRSSLGKLRHLGVKKAPNKSTLSYTNAHRPWQMYQDLFYQTLDVCKMAGTGKHRFRFKNKLLFLDAFIRGTARFNHFDSDGLNIFFYFVENSQASKPEAIHVFQLTLQFFDMRMKSRVSGNDIEGL
jgi:hypothetical protein